MADLERTRAVVETGEEFQGSVVPEQKAEVDRPVTINDGATVTNGVYGEAVTAGEKAVIDGPVMAKESIELTGSTVTSEVGTPGRVVCEDATIEGTVTGERVTLTNCAVYGTVIGGEVRLEDCSVIGTVNTERTLSLDGTTCYTFSVYGDATVRDTTVVLPQVLIDGKLSLEDSIPVLSVPLDDTSPDEGATFAQITEADRYEAEEYTYYTLAPRVLDLDSIRSKMAELEAFLRSAVLYVKTGEANFDEDYDAAWLREHFDIEFRQGY